MGVKSVLSKALILNNGYSLVQINNAAQIAFSPIEAAFEHHHYVVAPFCKGISITTKVRLVLKLLKHSETGILIGNGYKLTTIVRSGAGGEHH
ncbi:hypothetical protein [Colwellia sp. Bg11-28]|uniref:hypothetical protein n=1 Tax=Colwellia sp. Bg11-28 TaxID=2058305 RepID=UPI0012FF09C2|nr:hypothetical protein [Colwellia sp. Bg11-28]